MMTGATRCMLAIMKQTQFIRMAAGVGQNQNILRIDMRQYYSEPLSCRPVLLSKQPLQTKSSFIPKRNLWGWLNTIFNRVDESRIKDVGPDRACAEWLLRCGAFVKWRNMESWTKDYNSLPASGGRLLKIEEVDGTDSAVMQIGFPHFRGCKHIRRIVFHKASYIDDAALEQLSFLKDSLEELQISSCGNVTVEGLRHLKKLTNLTYLLMYDLPEIQDKDAVVKELEEALPNCAVVFPYALAKDDPNIKEKE